MDYDLLIIGGGMVGASLAVALKAVPLRIGIVEAVPFSSAEQPSYDSRAIALSQGSKRILDAIGVWQAMGELGVTPITRIHVSDRGHFGATRMSAADERVEALGYVVEAAVMGRAFAPALESLPNTDLICPARITGVTVKDEQVEVELEHDGQHRRLTSRLLVAADGGRSTVREMLGAKTFGLGYGQTAVIANIVTDRAHEGFAYERFTDSGPLALLPSNAPRGWPGEEHGNRRWSLVWTVHDENVEQVMGLGDGAFIAALQRRLGRRAGRVVESGPRSAYPLSLLYVKDHVRPRVTFIGNAAHLIHPVGGQGFNLGLRDAAELAEVVADSARRGEDPGTLENLKAYAEWRRPDYLRVMGMTDGLVRTFSNNFTPLVVARNLGLLGMDLLPGLRHGFARQFMGLSGKQPKLSLGKPLAPRD